MFSFGKDLHKYLLTNIRYLHVLIQFEVLNEATHFCSINDDWNYVVILQANIMFALFSVTPLNVTSFLSFSCLIWLRIFSYFLSSISCLDICSIAIWWMDVTFLNCLLTGLFFLCNKWYFGILLHIEVCLNAWFFFHLDYLLWYIWSFQLVSNSILFSVVFYNSGIH